MQLAIQTAKNSKIRKFENREVAGLASPRLVFKIRKSNRELSWEARSVWAAGPVPAPGPDRRRSPPWHGRICSHASKSANWPPSTSRRRGVGCLGRASPTNWRRQLRRCCTRRPQARVQELKRWSCTSTASSCSSSSSRWPVPHVLPRHRGPWSLDPVGAP